jgi:hypothetical protein
MRYDSGHDERYNSIPARLIDGHDTCPIIESKNRRLSQRPVLTGQVL